MKQQHIATTAIYVTDKYVRYRILVQFPTCLTRKNRYLSYQHANESNLVLKFSPIGP